MSAGPTSDDSDQDFEINLAPIIDCFTVLITYLLVSASFISLSTLDVAVATASDEPPAAQPAIPPTTLTVELLPSREIRLIVGGPAIENIAVTPTPQGEWNIKAVTDHIDSIKKKAPALAELSVKADPSLKYKQVIRVIEYLKKTMPKVFLGE